VIVTKKQVHAIMHGEDEVEYPYEPPAVGTVQAVQTKVGKRASCYVLIEDHWPHAKGGHMVRLKLHHQEQPAHFLRRGGGYTDQADKAVSDPYLGTEPEALLPEELEHLVSGNRAKAGHQRTKRRKEQDMLSMEAKIVEYRKEAAHRRIDIRNEVRLIGRLKRQGKSVDNPVIGIKRKLDQDLNRAA
jgi:hypothetical protein